jgi:hypothetical protein
MPGMRRLDHFRECRKKDRIAVQFARSATNPGVAFGPSILRD